MSIKCSENYSTTTRAAQKATQPYDERVREPTRLSCRKDEKSQAKK